MKKLKRLNAFLLAVVLLVCTVAAPNQKCKPRAKK